MLVLADTYGLRVDLYKLCQWILKTSCNRSGTSLSYIKIREFLSGKLACGVNRGTGLVYYYVLDRSVKLLYKVCDDKFRLP